MISQRSFTQDVKEELLALEFPIEEQVIVLSAVLKCSAKLRQKKRPILEILSSFSGLIKTTTQIIDWILFDCQYQIKSSTRRNFNKEREVYSLEIYNHLDQILSLCNLEVIDQQLCFKQQKYKFDNNLMFLFIRYCFICLGSVNSPKKEKQYHLELRIKDARLQRAIINFCQQFNIFLKVTKRKNTTGLYLNKSEEIADFLNLIGCQKTLFQFEDERIERDLYLMSNRCNNADNANIYRTVNASQKQIEAINFLKNNKQFDQLSIKAQKVANLRLAYPQSSLAELAEINEDDLTKSNISYHLKNIVKQAFNEE